MKKFKAVQVLQRRKNEKLHLVTPFSYSYIKLTVSKLTCYFKTVGKTSSLTS